MSLLTVFRAHLASCQYAFRDGKIAHFVKLGDKPSTYMTDKPDEIKQLQAEVDAGHPHIYVPEKEDERTIDTEYDPMAKLKAEARAQVMAEFGLVPTAGRSSTANAPILGGMANSQNIQGATAENVKAVPVVPAYPEVTKVDPIPVTSSEQVDPSADTSVKLSMTDKLAALKADSDAKKADQKSGV